jgi:serine/threonine protein kinase
MGAAASLPSDEKLKSIILTKLHNKNTDSELVCEQLEPIFKRFDQNGDGRISRDEFVKAVDLIGFKEIPGPKMDELLSRFDANGDGFVDYHEFLQFFNNVLQRSLQTPKGVVKNWKKMEKIGQGAFGTVYKGLDESTGKFIAIKELEFNQANENQVSELQQEVEIMKGLHHDNIVRYIGTDFPTPGKLRICSEWVPGGSLQSMVTAIGKLSENVVRIYTTQILTGLSYLHKKNIIHRDIKGDNILVTDSGVVKLTDFGTSKASNSNFTIADENQTLRGTPYYMAPEVVMQTGHGRKSDIWSFGGTVLHMVTGSPPWKEKGLNNIMALLYHITNSDDPPHVPEEVTEDLRAFILICFKRDPKDRPTADLLMLHKFILGEESPPPPMSALGQKDHLMDTMDHFRHMSPSVQQMQAKGKQFGDANDSMGSTMDANYSMNGSDQYQIWMADKSKAGNGGLGGGGGNTAEESLKFAPLNLTGGHHLVEDLHEPTDNWPAWAKQEPDATVEPKVGSNPFATNPFENPAPSSTPQPLNLSIGNPAMGGSMNSSLGRTLGGEAYLAREERPLSAAAYDNDHSKERQAEEDKLRKRREQLAEQKREEEEYLRQMQQEKAGGR